MITAKMESSRCPLPSQNRRQLLLRCTRPKHNFLALIIIEKIKTLEQFDSRGDKGPLALERLHNWVLSIEAVTGVLEVLYLKGKQPMISMIDRNIMFSPSISFVKYDGLEGSTHGGVILGVNSSVQNLNIDERSISVS